MKKILMINPSFKGSLHSNIKVLAIPPLNLSIIVLYTPESCKVEIVNEALEDLEAGCKRFIKCPSSRTLKILH